MREYVADFETNTTEEGCKDNPVWAWGITAVDDYEGCYKYGNSIESFIRQLSTINGRVWFHNLKFDGKFIIDYLLRHGFTHVDARPEVGEFSTLIDEGGRFYSIDVNLIGNCIKIADSLKKVTMSIRDAAETFNLDMSKGEIDYETYRPKGHILTKEEKDYLERDVKILAQIMAIRLTRGAKLTTGSDCLTAYKDLVGTHYFMRHFPKLSPLMDTHLRQSYKGGFVWVNPKHKNKTIEEAGASYDVNSMYPWVMRTKELPHGTPQYYSKVSNITDKLWIARFSLFASLKKNAIPCIQIKGDIRYNPREYVTETLDYADLWLTNVDYQLIKQMYEIDIEAEYGGYVFESATGMFDDYVDYNMRGKIDAVNPGERYNYKLYLNNLYGKFGQKIVGKRKFPRLEDDIVKYKLADDKDRDPVYTALASFVTAYAREYLLQSALLFGDRFIYSDTDSIKVIGTEIPKELKIDDYELGAFKQEYIFKKARFIRAKTYAVQLDNGKYIYKCAGMPDGLKDVMRFDDFRVGFTNDTRLSDNIDACYLEDKCFKLVPKDVHGGVILVNTPFSIKE